MKKSNYYFGILLQFLLFCGFTTAANAIEENKGWASKYETPKVFIENKGQFHTTNSNEKVLYAYDDGSTMIYFTANGVTYSFLKRWKNEENGSERERKNLKNGKSHAEMEAEERKMNVKTDVVSFYWENANPTVEIVPEGLTTNWFSYNIKEKDGSLKNINYIKAYRKIIYKNLYPNIDVEYLFHPDNGIKYTLILHPGADISNVKIKYNGDVKLKNNGDLHITTLFGDIIDHAPSTFYTHEISKNITSQFVKTDNTISFVLGAYDHSKSITIDPWVQTPTITNTNSVWECERDGAGNVYIIGGDAPMKLLKYNSGGVLQWTYNTTWDTSVYWLGTFAVDLAGNSYVTSGTQSKISKVNTSGGNVWTNNNIGGSSQELWNITFNCDQTRLIIGGTGGIMPLRGTIFDLDVNNGNVVTSKIVGFDKALMMGATGPDEVRSICSAKNGKYYFLILDSVGRISQNFTACSSNSSLFKTTSTYDFAYYLPSYRFSNSGIMAIRANENFLYTQNGASLHKRSLSSLAILSSVVIPGGINVAGAFGNPGQVPGSSGIDLDSCGNVYVGSSTGIYKYDANLNQVGFVSLPFTVFDVTVSTSGNVIVAGSTTNSGVRTGYVQSIASFTACNPNTLSCCDATICPVISMCSTAAAVTLTCATAGGVWSGAGVNASTGVFNPATSGAGVHTIIYTLPCGADSVTITVNACATLTACQEPNGNITVSGGTGPYTWKTDSAYTDCSGCFGGTCMPPICNGVPGIISTTFATGTTATPPGTYPISVTDAFSNTLVITSLGSLPNCSSTCPTLTVTVSNIVHDSCFGQSAGSFNASTSGGASPWDYNLVNGSGTTVATFINIAAAQSFTGLPAGTYTLNVLDNNACPGTTTITITQPPAATTTAAAGPDQSICINSATLAGNVPTVGAGLWTLISGTGTITTPTSATSGLTGIGIGTTVFQWTISNAPCPSSSDQVTITNTGGGTLAAAGSDQSICVNSATLAGNTPSPGTGLWTLISGSGTITSPSSATSGITGLGVGANVFQWTITNAPCPATSDQVTITFTGGASVAAAGPDQSICSNSTILAGNSASPGTGLWTLISGTGIITSPSSATSGITGLGIGTAVFEWTINNPPCPSTSDQVSIVNTGGGPTVTIASQTNVACYGENTGSTTASITGGTGTLTYLWTPGGGNNITANNLTAGSYTISVTDALSCVGFATVLITQADSISASVSTTPTDCGSPTGSATVSASGGTGSLEYSWTGGGNTVTINNIGTGSHTVIITDSLGCTKTASGTVTSLGGPTASASNDVEIASGASTQLTSTGGGTYSWTPITGLDCSTCQNPIASPAHTTTYCVTVTDANSCTDSACVKVIVIEPCPNDFTVPNAFSPNNDGHNETFSLPGLKNCVSQFNIIIYDRWGEKVFETDDPAKSWDGTFNGKPMGAAVFVYSIKTRLFTGEELNKKGNISLIR